MDMWHHRHCGGGGGIPVRYDEQGNMMGVEAVVNKSHTAALLADEVGIDTIVFVSHWDKIKHGFCQIGRRWIHPIDFN